MPLALFKESGINYGQPANFTHPLNHRDLYLWLLALPDNKAQQWRDRSQKRNHGTLTNMDSSSWAGPRGRPGGLGSLAFVAADNVDIPGLANVLGGHQKCSCSFWVRPNSLANNSYIIDCPFTFRVRYDASPGRITLVARGLTAGTVDPLIEAVTITMEIGVWKHVAAVVDDVNDSHAVYINGKLVGTSTTNLGIFDTDSDQAFSVSNGTGSLDANVDDVRFYLDRALNAGEVFELYQQSAKTNARLLNRFSTLKYFNSAGGGGTTHSISVAENLALFDTVLRIANANRIVTDNLGLFDTVLRIASANRIVSENLGLSDTFARIALNKRLVTDNLGMMDTVARVASAFRVIADSLGLQDVVLRIANAKRVVTDNLALSDAFFEQHGPLGVITRLVAETFGMSDNAAWELVRRLCADSQTRPDEDFEWYPRAPDCPTKR